MRAVPLLSAAVLLAAFHGPAFADCQCRADGRVFEQGQTVCLSYPDGKKLARCDMILNNSSWKNVQDGCPEADAGALALPAVLVTPAPHPHASHTH
jgi:hypothetical protein